VSAHPRVWVRAEDKLVPGIRFGAARWGNGSGSVASVDPIQVVDASLDLAGRLLECLAEVLARRLDLSLMLADLRADTTPCRLYTDLIAPWTLDNTMR